MLFQTRLGKDARYVVYHGEEYEQADGDVELAVL